MELLQPVMEKEYVPALVIVMLVKATVEDLVENVMTVWIIGTGQQLTILAQVSSNLSMYVPYSVNKILNLRLWLQHPWYS